MAIRSSFMKGTPFMQKTDLDPNDFLAQLPDEIRGDMVALDTLIGDIFSGHPRTLWEGVFWGGTEQQIIGYGDLVQQQSRGRKVEWFMVGLALQKNYISLYINAVEDRQYVVEKYKGDMGKVKTGKSSISFRSLDDVNLDALKRVLRIAKEHLPAG